MHRDNMKRAQVRRAKKALDKIDELTERQKDMVLVAMMSVAVPYSLVEQTIDRIENDPAGFMKEIRIPVKRY